MEADIKQQKVHGQETNQALLLVYNRPSLTRRQVGSVSTRGNEAILPHLWLKCSHGPRPKEL